MASMLRNALIIEDSTSALSGNANPDAGHTILGEVDILLKFLTNF